MKSHTATLPIFHLITFDIRKLIILFCVILPVIVDAIYGFTFLLGSPIPVGVPYRGLIWMYGVILLIFDLFNGKKIHWLFLVFLIYPIFILLWIIRDPGGFSLARELTWAFKFTYAFALLSIFIHHQVSQSAILKGLILNGLITASFFMFSLTTGIGLETYGEYAFGISSFFQAPNDVGISLLCILGFHLFLNPLRLSSFSFTFTSTLMFVSLVSIGSTAGVFGSLVVVSIYLFKKLMRLRPQYALNYVLKWSTAMILLVSLAGSILYLIQFINNNGYLREKYIALLNEGPRSNLRKEASEALDQFSFWENWMGYGVSSFNYRFAYEMAPYIRGREKEVQYKTVEMDYFDLLGMSYLLGGFILCIYFLQLWRILLNTLKTRNPENKTLLGIYVLVLLHAMLAGHVLFSPTSLLVISFMLLSTRSFYYQIRPFNS